MSILGRLVRSLVIWVGLGIWVAAGVLAIRYYAAPRSVLQEAGGPVPSAAPSAGQNRPAEAYAVQFVTAYLTFDAAHADAYRTAVAPYLAQGIDPMAGWNGRGTESHPLAEVPLASTQDGQATLVTVAVELGDRRWLTLAVPIETSDEGQGMAVSALPALVAGPHHGDLAPPSDARPVDQAASQAATPALQGFFAAYASGDQSRIVPAVVPGTVIEGLGGGVTLGALVSVRVVQGGSTVRSGSAVVAWHDAQSGATFQQAYRLGLRVQSGRWLVSSLAPAE